MSTDSGNTYPISLATGVTNSGSYSIVVPNNQGTQNRIMVKASNNIFLDISDTNFTIGAPVVCNANVPTGLAASNVASTSATLDWDEVTGAAYDLRYRIVGNPTWTTISVAALSSDLTGLDSVTNYEAQVASKCIDGSTSAYSSSVLFTTTVIPPCSGTQFTTFPYTETFDSGIGDWTQENGDDGDWTLNANETGSSGTGPSDDITGSGNYFYTEASSNGTTGEIGENATAILVSPCFDLTSVTAGTFSFYYHMFGDDVGSLNVEVTIDDGGNWTNVFSVSGNIGDFWNAQNIDISSYFGEIVKFRFIGLTGNDFSSDIAIDHIGIGDPLIPEYCASNGNNTNDEYIGRVQLNTLDNNNSGVGTDGTGYSDFTGNSALTTELFGGSEYTITITPVWPGTVYNEGYSVWIDYNNDADFDDSGEQVWTQSATPDTTVSGTFTVPTNISYGQTTRMRVSLKYNGIPTACESFGYGEVEDYNINLAYDGLLFTNNGWIPNAPSDTTTTDNAFVLDGTYTVNSDIILNNLTINDAATIDVLEGESIELNGSLINNGDLILNSTSIQYSSLIVNGSVMGGAVYKRFVNSNSGGNDLISPPLVGETWSAFLGSDTNASDLLDNGDTNPTTYAFGPFDKLTDSYINYTSETSATLESGTGYRAGTDVGVTGTTLTFTGNVSTTAINVDIISTGVGDTYPEWNLIGNPYPSYIKLSDFLSTNINEFLSSSAAIYGYDGDTSNGWKIWNLAYASMNPNSIITPGQGFLVSSKSGGGTMTFDPSFRATASGDPQLDDDFIDGRDNESNEIAYLKLEMNSNLNSYSTDFYFTDLASSGLDVGYDASAFNGVAPDYAIYSHLVENSTGVDMSIQSVSFNDVNNSLVIPLGINAAQGEQITVSMPNNTLSTDVEVYLEDNLTNTFTLLNSNNYSFTTGDNLSGIGRFYLRFEAEALDVIDNELSTLLVYTSDSPKQIIIEGPLENTTKAILYDVQGREVLSQLLDVNENLQLIDVNDLSSGVYVIHLQSTTRSISRKIIIK